MIAINFRQVSKTLLGVLNVDLYIDNIWKYVYHHFSSTDTALYNVGQLNYSHLMHWETILNGGRVRCQPFIFEMFFKV